MTDGIWRGGREAEGAPLLREYGAKSSIEGSNPSLSARERSRGSATLGRRAPVAQLDRASVYGTEGHRFESCRARFEKSCYGGAFLLLENE